jgi:hypothetical protein
VFEDLNLTITQRAAMATDGWRAGGAEHEKAIVEPMVPMSILNDGVFGQFFDFFKTPILAPFTPFSEFEPGCVMGDVVPKDSRVQGSNVVTLCKD